MNLSVKTVEKPRRGAVLASASQQDPVKAFMDDLTITAKSFPEGRWILENLFKIIAGARMEFKPSQSRSLVLRDVCVQENSSPLSVRDPLSAWENAIEQS